jgi:hypothetical protein
LSSNSAAAIAIPYVLNVFFQWQPLALCWWFLQSIVRPLIVPCCLSHTTGSLLLTDLGTTTRTLTTTLNPTNNPSIHQLKAIFRRHSTSLRLPLRILDCPYHTLHSQDTNRQPPNPDHSNTRLHQLLWPPHLGKVPTSYHDLLSFRGCHRFLATTLLSTSNPPSATFPITSSIHHLSRLKTLAPRNPSPIPIRHTKLHLPRLPNLSQVHHSLATLLVPLLTTLLHILSPTATRPHTSVPTIQPVLSEDNHTPTFKILPINST